MANGSLEGNYSKGTVSWRFELPGLLEPSLYDAGGLGLREQVESLSQSKHYRLQDSIVMTDYPIFSFNLTLFPFSAYSSQYLKHLLNQPKL